MCIYIDIYVYIYIYVHVCIYICIHMYIYIYVYIVYIYIWISSRTHMYTPHAEGCAEGSQSQGQGEGEGQESHLGCLRSYSSLSCRFSVRVLGQFPCYPGIGEVQRPIARWTRHFVDTCRHVLWGAMVGNVCCASLWDESRFQWKMDDVCCVAVGCCLVWLQSSSWKTRTRAVPVSLCSWIAGFHQPFVDDFSIFFHWNLHLWCGDFSAISDYQIQANHLCSSCLVSGS